MKCFVIVIGNVCDKVDATKFLADTVLGCVKKRPTSFSSIIFPLSKIATRSQQVLITDISCVINKIVIFNVSRIFFNNSKIVSVVSGSNADVASSDNNTEGFEES